MTRTPGVTRILIPLAMIVLLLGLHLGPASALGPAAPPQIKGAMVFIETTPGGTRLVAWVNPELPGGIVPLNVQSVTVAVPGYGSPFTIPLNRNDLSTENYWANLTSLGVVGYPTGTYTFTVTDTSGGVSTATDTLNAQTILPALTSVTMTGLISAPAANGPVSVFNLPATPTPTVSWAAVAGAAIYRVRVWTADLDDAPNLYQEYVSATSHTLPAGVFVAGRRYVVRVEAFDNALGMGCSPTPCTFSASDARSRNQIEFIVPGPEVFVNAPRGPFTAGQQLTVGVRIYNQVVPATVDIQGWIGIPGGGIEHIFEYFDIPIPANPSADFYNGPLWGPYTFNGGEPAGTYVIGIRLVDSCTGREIAFNTRTFIK